MKYENIKAVAFDLIGTVFDPATIEPIALDAYVRQLQQWRETRVYSPLIVAKEFAHARPFPDAARAFEELKLSKIETVAASNVPAEIIRRMGYSAKRQGKVINFNHICDFHKVRKLKPSLLCYAMIPEALNCRADEVLFVTSNRGVGDDTEPQRIGMQTRLIDRKAGETLLDLARDFI